MKKATNRKTEKVITVGTCTEYLIEYEGTVPEFNSRADLDALCIEENQLAYTKSGATITYSKETDELSDDLGKLRKTIMKSDSAKAKFGLFGWTGRTLEKLESTARVTENDGIRVTKIGGLGNDNGKQYMLIMHHQDKQDGDCWWVLVGKNTAGMELAYSVDDGTKVEPEFTADSMDKDGTLVIFIEEIEIEQADSDTSGGGTGTDENAG